MSNNEIILSKEEMMNLQVDMNALQDKHGIDLVAVLDSSNAGIIPRIAIMKRPELSKEAVEPATVVDEVSEETLEDSTSESAE